MLRIVLLVCLLLCRGREVEAQNDPQPDSALTLQEAVDTALAQHPTLRVGQASVDAAQQRVRQQVANYLPRAGTSTPTRARSAQPAPPSAGYNSLLMAVSYNGALPPPKSITITPPTLA
jgi:outer membrane protein TolC